jgi:phosphonate metabolism-associated iron-containing alcohol dehydrogenase
MSSHQTHRYCNPVDSFCGAGVINQLPAILGNKRVYLVIFPEARKLGLLDRFQGLFGDRLVAVDEAIHPNPDVAELRDKYSSFWNQYCETDVIVAVGGGSVIDTAKALMVGTKSATFDELLELLAMSKPFKPTETKMLVAVPTTAGTGSEVTPWATIWDRNNGKKYSLHLDETWPAYAFIDPELMVSLPPSVTLQSGLDALSHALEAIWNRNANPISDVFAIAAAKEVIAVLPQLMQQPSNIELRQKMAQAALKAGMAFSNTKTALAHSISYEMTLRHGLPHGIACSFTLPMVLERAIGKDKHRDSVLKQVFGDDLARAPSHLRDFLVKLGVKVDFADYGVSDDESSAMIAKALDGVRGKNFIGVAA